MQKIHFAFCSDSDLNIVFIQQVKEGDQVDSLGEVLLLLNCEVGEKPEKGVLPLLLRFLTQPRKNSILTEILS